MYKIIDNTPQVGDEFCYTHQPHGTVYFTIESIQPVSAPNERTAGNAYCFNRAADGWLRLTGTVIRGSVTSRLFHATSSRDLEGESYSVEVPPEDFKRGHYATIAM